MARLMIVIQSAGFSGYFLNVAVGLEHYLSSRFTGYASFRTDASAQNKLIMAIARSRAIATTCLTVLWPEPVFAYRGH